MSLNICRYIIFKEHTGGAFTPRSEGKSDSRNQKVITCMTFNFQPMALEYFSY